VATLRKIAVLGFEVREGHQNPMHSPWLLLVDNTGFSGLLQERKRQCNMLGKSQLVFSLLVRCPKDQHLFPDLYKGSSPKTMVDRKRIAALSEK